MNDYLFNHNANTHWEYPTSNETDRIIDESRETIAEFLNAKPSEIAFGQNMTSLTFHLSRALGRRFEPGDEIVVTELDHHANSDTWRALAQDRDLKIRVLPLNVETGQLELDQLGDLMNKRTRLVAIGAASNILGTINPIEEMVAMAREAGAITFVDAVHYAAHELIDVQRIGCDFLARLRVQILRAAYRDSVRPRRSHGIARRSKAAARSRLFARKIGDRNAESRRHRRSGRGGRFPCVACGERLTS